MFGVLGILPDPLLALFPLVVVDLLLLGLALVPHVGLVAVLLVCSVRDNLGGSRRSKNIKTLLEFCHPAAVPCTPP